MTQQTTQDYLQLISEANAIFQKAFPGAFTFTATGMPASGVAKTEEDLTIWMYLAKSDKGGAALKYANGEFGQPVPADLPLGLEFVPLPQGKIRLREAIVILNKHGYKQGFGSVSLGTPVYYHPQPMFWFCVDRQTQGVSASTGEFFADLFPCNAGELKLPRR